jgi:predicted DNA-binding WGR domain protein
LTPNAPKVLLQRICPSENKRRFYALEIQTDLFGRIVLCRTWGRIDKPGRIRLESHGDHSHALAELKKTIRTKQSRGYVIQEISR